MSNLDTRLAKLEEQAKPAHSNALGFIDRDTDGNDKVVTLNGQRFERQAGESGAAVRERAVEELGPFDNVLWVMWGKEQAPATERGAA